MRLAHPFINSDTSDPKLFLKITVCALLRINQEENTLLRMYYIPKNRLHKV